MSPRNLTLGDLCGNLTDEELWLLGDDASTRDPLWVLRRFFYFIRCLAGDFPKHYKPLRGRPTSWPVPSDSKRPWDALFPCYNIVMDPADGNSALCRATTERPIHVRGGFKSKCDPSALVHGPAAFGSGVKLRLAVGITGPAYVGTGTYIGHHSRLTNCFVRGGVKVRYCARVVNCFLGSGVVIGDKVTLSENGGPFGLIAGDDCKVGDGAVIAPGTTLMPGVTVGLGVRILKPRQTFRDDVTHDVLP